MSPWLLLVIVAQTLRVVDGVTYDIYGSTKWGSIENVTVIETNAHGALVEFEGRTLATGVDPLLDASGRVIGGYEFRGEVVSVTDAGCIVNGSLSPSGSREAVLQTYYALKPRIDALQEKIKSKRATKEMIREAKTLNALLDGAAGGEMEDQTFFLESNAKAYDGDRIKGEAVFDAEPYEYVTALGAKKTVRRFVHMVPRSRKALVKNLRRVRGTHLAILSVMRVGETNGMSIFDCGVATTSPTRSRAR